MIPHPETPRFQLVFGVHLAYKPAGIGMSKPTRKQRLIRKEFPKVRQLRRRGNTYYAVELAQSVQANGVPSVAKNIANLDDEKLTRWNEQLGAHGKTIEGAVGFMLEHLDKEQRRRESEHVGSLLSK